MLSSSAGAAAANGQSLAHIAIAVERNPFSELLEVTDTRYVMEAGGKD